MIVTINPSDVRVGVPKVGVRAVPVVAVPVTVADPFAWAVFEVVCVIVAEAPGDNPVTVKTRVEPVVDVTATEPLLTVGVAQVYEAS